MREKSLGNQNAIFQLLYTHAMDLNGRTTNTFDLVYQIRRFIIDHRKSLSEAEHYEPQTIMESRFTSPAEMFERGMTSCGAMTSIAAEMLRHIGFKVALIHGENETSVDHAWISVQEPENGAWIDYDVTREDLSVPSTHVEKMRVGSWEEIRAQIEDDHATLRKRRKARGFSDKIK